MKQSQKTYGRTDRLSNVGLRDASASKKTERKSNEKKVELKRDAIRQNGLPLITFLTSPLTSRLELV